MDRPFILHVDEHLVVIDKPAGLPAVPGRAPGLQDCAASRVQALHPDARVVHRLDMATSGLMLMARGADAQRALGAAFEQRRIAKRYTALAHGHVEAVTGEIDLPLAADWPRRPRQKVDLTSGKPSTTRWRVVAEPTGAPGPSAPYDAAEGPSTRLELEPLTGRTHQLRVHLAAIGHPLLGDTLYAPPEVQARAPRLCLHASRLVLAHPATGLTLAFDSLAEF